MNKKEESRNTEFNRRGREKTKRNIIILAVFAIFTSFIFLIPESLGRIEVIEELKVLVVFLLPASSFCLLLDISRCNRR